MSEPQQPEIARSRRSAASESAAKAQAAGSLPVDDRGVGPVPEDNLPGHHPEVEQDKPTEPPKARARKPRQTKNKAKTARRFPFRRNEPFATVSRAFGVTDDNGYVEVDAEQLEIRFGPWHVTTPLSNVESAQVTGPFAWWKVIGPPHLSLRDRGITFATTDRKAVCIRFHRPVRGLVPGGLIRHPGATVTVSDPEDLARAINDARRAAA